jgi:hypothetical protein
MGKGWRIRGGQQVRRALRAGGFVVHVGVLRWL